KYTLAIFNPVAHVNPALTQIAPFWKRWGRCPYVCAVSTDGGLTFERMFYLENDLDNDYCYPAVLEGDDYFLVAYYHSNGTSVALNSTKIIKVYYHELEERQ
ncbi:MAG: hypothetical protein IJC25_02035, partial [Clostridia bacterium]|nr:hypothetical protein [Clostridia bacterium]